VTHASCQFFRAAHNTGAKRLNGHPFSEVKAHTADALILATASISVQISDTTLSWLRTRPGHDQCRPSTTQRIYVAVQLSKPPRLGV